MDDRVCEQCGETFTPKKRWAEDDPYQRGRFCSRACKERARQASGKQADSWRKWDIKRKYGVTPEDYDRMLEEQGGACAICRTTEPKGRTSKHRPDGSVLFHIDHCHDTGVVRGLLCTECNTGLGKFQHDIELLQAAIGYLAPAG